METRNSENGQTTAFATKPFQRYDIIITDSDPLLHIPQKQSEDQELFHAIAHTYTKLAPKARTEILKLYHPNSTSPEREEAIAVHRAKTAASTLSKAVNISTEDLTKVFLSYLCNAFEGGLLYEQASRFNHSCNPNCMYTLNDNDDSITIRAITSINAGDELTVSYLGIFLWSGRDVRRAKLQRDKYFTCHCSRCDNARMEVASAIPSPKCHPRSQHMLAEEVQWEEVDVSYCCPDYSIENNEDDDDVVHYRCAKSSSCEHLSLNKNELAVIRKVEEKVANRISSNSNTADDMDISQELDEQLFQMSCSVLGAKHWTTNFMLLSLLDRSLSSFNAAMLLGESPDFEELAESIDSLERLWKFASNFKDQLHVANLPVLLFKQTVGVARSLVALGDVKSKKYASEWISGAQYGGVDLISYVEAFEGKEMLKVVQTIGCAYKSGDSSMSMGGVGMEVDDDVDSGGGSSKKRAKK